MSTRPRGDRIHYLPDDPYEQVNIIESSDRADEFRGYFDAYLAHRALKRRYILRPEKTGAE